MLERTKKGQPNGASTQSDQRLCFFAAYLTSLRNFLYFINVHDSTELPSVAEQVRNPEDWLSSDEAQFSKYYNSLSHVSQNWPKLHLKYNSMTVLSFYH